MKHSRNLLVGRLPDQKPFWLLVLVGALLLGSPCQATQDKIVRIATPDGVGLRERPSTSVETTAHLDVGDGVSVLKKMTSEGAKWDYVIAKHCVKGNNCSETGRGWVRERYLANEARFKRISNWKQQHIEAGIGDYWFTMDISQDGAVLLKYTPCLDCGETGACPRNFRKENGQCVGRGHLFRFKDFLWAKGVNQYLFVNKNGELCSVYSSKENAYCALPYSTTTS